MIQSEQIDQVLRIEWRHKVADLEAQTLTFSGGVKAYYGPTTLSCDTLVLSMKEGAECGLAEGNVLIEDPEGMIRAKRFEFEWVLRTGRAQDVEVHIERLVIKAQSIDVKPDLWTLNKISAFPCPDEPGRITITGDSATIRPGKGGVIRRVTLGLFGRNLLTLPKHSFSLDKRAAGFEWPTLSYRPGSGVGVTWSSDIPVMRDTFLSGSFSGFPDRRPRTDFMLSHDLLPAKSERPVRPGSELGDPFSDSYMDNVSVDSPAAEFKRLSASIFTVGIGTAWNLSAGGSQSGGSISKPWDLAVEAGGNVGGFALIGQARVQRIGQTGGEYQTRAVYSGTLGFPEWSIAPTLSSLARIDGRYFMGNEHFGWLRGIAGLSWTPSDAVRLSVGRGFSVQTGTPGYDFDDLNRRNTWQARADLSIGPTSISLLGKYDTDRSSLFDREVYIRQLAGCFELYMIYRQEPRRFGIGFQFRSLDIFERLKERDLQRQEKAPKAPHLVMIGK